MYPPGMECSALINSACGAWRLRPSLPGGWGAALLGVVSGQGGGVGGWGLVPLSLLRPGETVLGRFLASLVRITCGQWLVSVDQPKVSEELPQLVCLEERKIDQFP